MKKTMVKAVCGALFLGLVGSAIASDDDGMPTFSFPNTIGDTHCPFINGSSEIFMNFLKQLQMQNQEIIMISGKQWRIEKVGYETTHLMQNTIIFKGESETGTCAYEAHIGGQKMYTFHMRREH